MLLVALALPVSAQNEEGNMVIQILSQFGITKSLLAISFGAAIVVTGLAWFVARRGWLRFSWIDYGVIALTTMTGVIHLLIGLTGEWLLLANGVGFMGLLGLIYLPFTFLRRWRTVLVAGMIVYTLVTIAGYFVTHDHVDNLGLATKAVEVLLIVGLLALVLPIPGLQRLQQRQLTEGAS